MPLLIDEMLVDDLDRFVAIVFQALATELEDRFRLHDQATRLDRMLDQVNKRRCSSFRLYNDQYAHFSLARYIKEGCQQGPGPPALAGSKLRDTPPRPSGCPRQENRGPGPRRAPQARRPQKPNCHPADRKSDVVGQSVKRRVALGG